MSTSIDAPIDTEKAGAADATSGGPVGGMLRGAISILMRRRPAPTRQRGSDWRENWGFEKVLPAGTVLFKGSWEPGFTPGDPSAFTWFTTDKSLAQRFSAPFDAYDEDEDTVPLVHEYVLEREIRLPLIRSEGEVARFCGRYGIDDAYPAKTRADVMASGLPGWVAVNRYKQWGGDDILIGDVDALSYQRSFDQGGNDLGKLDRDVSPGLRF